MRPERGPDLKQKRKNTIADPEHRPILCGSRAGRSWKYAEVILQIARAETERRNADYQSEHTELIRNQNMEPHPHACNCFSTDRVWPKRVNTYFFLNCERITNPISRSRMRNMM